MSTRPTSRKSSRPEQSDERPFLDLAAIESGEFAKVAKRILADAERKLPPPKRDPKKDEEYEKMIRELFGEPVPREK